ncbi:MAG: DUF1800 domain-containing protein [Cytophagales bacterium]|nr:MAG: DUF1800 domain-containing protein [Cytophagales bacterium]
MPVWNQTNAKHLLARALFGYSRKNLETALSTSLENFVDNFLLANVAAPPIPAAWTWLNDKPDPNAPNGERNREMIAWWFGLMANEGTSMREKMVLFWHNHYVSEYEKVNFPQILHLQNKLFRDNAFGNFKQLTKLVTIDPAMLIYLDGQLNNRNAPNENYGRELLELFTIGIGHYTETDVKEAARSLTGWQNNYDNGIKSVLNRNRFDNTNKTFMGQTGNFGYEEIINIIFNKEETAKFLCRKLYKEFVYATPDENFITQMANVFRNNDYNIKPLLSFLFKSEHFYKPEFIGVKIKSPVELLVGTVKYFDIANADTNYMREAASPLQQVLFDPPNVKGWQGQRNWISTTSYPLRNQYTDAIINNRKANGVATASRLPMLSYARSYKSAENAVQFVQDIVDLMYQFPISKQRQESLLTTLLSGTTVANWTTNTPQAEQRIQQFFRTLMRTPEYQLC